MIVSNAGKATIANGQTVSNAVDLNERVLTAIIMPAAWTAADITFQASNIATGTFKPVKKGDGSVTPIIAYTIKTPAADDYITLDPDAFAGIRYLKVVSSAAQGAERVITLLGRSVS